MVKLTETLVLARSRASDLESVRKLNCWGSDLTDVSILKKMSNVQIVSLSVNQISTLADFSQCQNLEELYIRKNAISQLNEICFLRSLPKLRVLWLSDNPCATVEHYRMTVLRTLPNLQKLDNVSVQQDEINEAIEQGMELSLACAGDGPGASNHIRAVTSVDIPPPYPGAASGCDTTSLVEDASGGDASSESLSLEETNKIRAQLGLKPLPVSKVSSCKPKSHHSSKFRNANILQAVLHLIRELDVESLEVVSDAVRNRLETL